MRRTVLTVAALAVAGCATGGKLRENAHVIRSDIEKAKRSGAVRCAPKELALAEANVQFSDEEVTHGNATRAKQHLDAAEKSVKEALRLSKTCGPTQVLIGKKIEEEEPKKRIIEIEKTDKDGDGVADLDDACPELPGKPEFGGCPDSDGDGVPDAEDACPQLPGPRETQGCPVSKDTDADGTPDDIDRCPLDPEDKDAFQDEDGCPDADNDADGVVDKADACPGQPGPIENRGCPVLDRDADGVPDPEDRCPDVAGLKALAGCPDADADGIADAEDRCPQAAGPRALAGCPDTDADGIADAEDRCPQQAGPVENGGCPDTDRDGDTFPDRLDKCPDQFGAAPDGCPKKYTLVEVKKERIEIKQQVNFATAKFRVLPSSFPLLNQVVEVLADFPKMRVSIEGHTDSVGGEASNMRLSQKRAEAVRDYLVSKGVSPSRLEAIGYGPTKPLMSNKTARGKAKNRRTEFRIVSLE
jgi:outer membrane protein OmpA-like peptidoglycan-associated protein